MLTSLIDIRTLSFVAIALGAMMSLAMLMVWLTRKTYPGFGLWTAGTGTFAVAFILLAMRGQIPDVFSILLANVLIVVAAVLYYEGVLSFREFRSRRIVSTVLILFMAAVTSILYFVHSLIWVSIVPLP
jgi:hypothetical protein